MNFPDIEIQCEETTPKPCKNKASHIIVMHHVGPECKTQDFALCGIHAIGAAAELSGALLGLALLKAAGEDQPCPDCGKQVTENDHVGKIQKI